MQNATVNTLSPLILAGLNFRDFRNIKNITELKVRENKVTAKIS